MSKTITVPLMGETPREQWHGVVYILRRMGRDMTDKGYNDLLDELDRYIDGVEDILDKLREEDEDDGE